MDPLNIYITQKDIDSGLRGECSACPTALAVFRRLSNSGIQEDNILDILVGVTFTRIALKVGARYEEYTFTMPKPVTDFIIQFDANHRVKPLRATLQPYN